MPSTLPFTKPLLNCRYLFYKYLKGVLWHGYWQYFRHYALILLVENGEKLRLIWMSVDESVKHDFHSQMPSISIMFFTQSDLLMYNETETPNEAVKKTPPLEKCSDFGGAFTLAEVMIVEYSAF